MAADGIDATIDAAFRPLAKALSEVVFFSVRVGESELPLIVVWLITGALFLLVGVLYDRAHTREIAAFGGLWTHLPVYSAIMTLFAMASLGLPGLSGFVAEFMSFIGAFQTFPVLTAVGVLGVLLTAGYILRMIQRMFLGPFNKEKWGALTEIDRREIFTVAPLAILTIWIGVYPKPLADLIGTSVQWIQQLAVR